MNSKFLSMCGCLFLAAVFLLAGAAGGVYLYRELARSSFQAGPAVTERHEGPAMNAAEPAQNAVRLPLYHWSPEQAMARSKAGQALSGYARQYARIMENNAAVLNGVLKRNAKNLKAGEAQKMIAEFKRRRDAAPQDARMFIRSLVAAELKKDSRFADAYILEGELTFTQAPASADITSEVVAMLDKMKITLPPLPRQLDPQTGQPAK